jgi:hypothetical protein
MHNDMIVTDSDKHTSLLLRSTKYHDKTFLKPDPYFIGKCGALTFSIMTHSLTTINILKWLNRDTQYNLMLIVCSFS